MKKYFAIIILLTIASCKKEESFMNNAEIIGIDERKCLCCGGIEITIDDVANPNGSDYFLASALPSNFTITENSKFPIPVKIDWQRDTAHCSGNYVNVTRIATRY